MTPPSLAPWRRFRTTVRMPVWMSRTACDSAHSVSRPRGTVVRSRCNRRSTVRAAQVIGTCRQVRPSARASCGHASAKRTASGRSGRRRPRRPSLGSGFSSARSNELSAGAGAAYARRLLLARGPRRPEVARYDRTERPVTTSSDAPLGTGPVVIGYDGSPGAEGALVQAAALLAPRSALVIVVWEAGRAYESATWNAITLDVPAPTVDIRSAIELDRAVADAAERTAQRGAELARRHGLAAESMVVADEMSIAETLLRVAREQDAAALVVGAHRHGRLSEVLL